MARIEDVLQQNEIADSLVDPKEIAASYADHAMSLRVETPVREEQAEEQPESEYAEHGDDVLWAAVEDAKNNRFVYGDEAIEKRQSTETNEQRLASQSTDRDDWRAGVATREELEQVGALRPETEQQAQAQAQAQPEQAQPATAQQVNTGLQSLDAFIQEHQLNDPVSAKEFTLGLVETFGGELSSYNAERIGQTMSRVAESATQIYDATQGNPQQMPAVSPEAAKAFAFDLISACGGDPRAVKVDEQLLGNVAFAGAMNFIKAVRDNPGVTDMARLNSPEAAEWLYGNFLKAFGQDGKVNRAAALKFADTAGKYMLAYLERRGQIQQAQPQRTAKRSAARQERVPGGRIPGMKTNQDKNSPFNQKNVDSAINDYAESRRYARL